MKAKHQFKQAYRAFRSLGNAPNWILFDRATKGLSLGVCVAAGIVFCGRFNVK